MDLPEDTPDFAEPDRIIWKSPACDGANDQKGLATVDYRFGKGCVYGFEGKVLPAGEKAQERAALEGAVVAYGAAEHGVAGFDGVEDGLDGDREWHVEGDFRADLGEVAKVVGELDADWEDFRRHGKNSVEIHASHISGPKRHPEIWGTR